MSDDAVSISNARKQFAAIIGRVGDTPIYLTRHGKKVAAIVDADEFERLRELAEDMEDIRDAEQVLAEMRATGETPIPWDEVKADLGLT